MGSIEVKSCSPYVKPRVKHTTENSDFMLKGKRRLNGIKTC